MKTTLPKLVPWLVGVAMMMFSLPAVHAQTSLQDLFNGGSLIGNGSVFSNFQLVGDDGTAVVDFGTITVNTAGGGLDSTMVVNGNGQLQLSAGFESIIYSYTYDAVFAADQEILISDLSAGNPNAGAIDGYINLNNRVFDGAGVAQAEADAEIDPLFGINRPTDSVSFANDLTSFSVASSFSLFADANSSVGVDSYQTSFTAVPEPGSATLLLAAASTLLLRRRRQSAS